MIRKYGPIESFPASVLGAHHEHALLFKTLATLRTDAPLFANVDELEWRGPRPEFEALALQMGGERVLARVNSLATARVGL